MWVAPVLAVVAAQIVAMTAPRRLLLASPILALWFLSPLLAYITGLPLEHRHPPLNREHRAALRRTARRTWRFFEELLTPADNWLIPDNYQENRADVIAHRTSPTNIGLQLLAALGAYDFGYLSITGVVDRLEPTFDDAAADAALSRSFLQLVRHADARAAASGLHFDGRQRQSRRVSPHPGLGPDRADRITAARRRVGARRARRRARPVRGRDRAGDWRITRAISTARSTSCAPFCEQRPATLPDWRTILADIRERLTSLALLLHELDEPAASTGAGPAPHVSTWNEAGFWLERAEAAVAGRHAELERLTGWMTTVSGLLPSVMSLKVPSIAGVIRSCDLALEDLAAHRQSGRLGRSSKKHADMPRTWSNAPTGSPPSPTTCSKRSSSSFLFNAERQLFSIGYNVVDGRLDNSYYDILASEARLASFMAIALGKVSHEHWFKLGRSLTPSGSSRALLSWSASMFEYLMPLLVMRSHRGHAARRDLRGGGAPADRRTPPAAACRGASPSRPTTSRTRRGTISTRPSACPASASSAALPTTWSSPPTRRCSRRRSRRARWSRTSSGCALQGLSGRFGYYEAIDYTPERVPPDVKGGVVLLTYMAHHQGMGLLALDNLLNDSPMQRRFHADPRVEAAELLLQERIPRLVPLKNPPIEQAEHVPVTRGAIAPAVRRYVDAAHPQPARRTCSRTAPTASW